MAFCFFAVMSQSLIREEKLKSRKTIEELFKDGKSVKAYPIVAVYRSLSEEVSLDQVGFSVSKRRFKKAVSRNRIKRQLREVYRLNKDLYKDVMGNNLAVMFIYIAKKELLTSQLNEAMLDAMEKLKTANSTQS